MNIIDMSGHSPWLFARVDSIVTLLILTIFGLLVFVRSHIRALSILYGLIIASMLAMMVVSFGQDWLRLSVVSWLFLQSFCLYIAYLTFQTVFFDRFIACFKIRGNVGFFIVLTDFLGYTGTVVVLVLKEVVGLELDWASFYNGLAGCVGGICCVLFVASYVYLRQRYRIGGARVSGSEACGVDSPVSSSGDKLLTIA